MINLGNVLAVPVVGPLRAYESDAPIDTKELLAQLGGEGVYVHFDLDVDGERTGRLVFLSPEPGQEQPENERAMAAVAMLTTVHIKITGPAAFVGLTAERSFDIIKSSITE